MTPDALELVVRYYNMQLELQERITLLEEIIHQFCMDAEYHKRASDAFQDCFKGTQPQPHPIKGWEIT